MVLLAHLNKDYVVDIGFGDSVRSPLPLSGEMVTDVTDAYRITRASTSNLLFFQKRIDGDWISEYMFTLQPRSLQDFHEMNVFQQTSPDFHFTHNLICSIATPTGRLTMSGDWMIESIGTEKTRRRIASNAERRELLKRHLGIDLNRRVSEVGESLHG
ncbi:arylamine N-acetyltransferase [Alicyclobacillus acidoterrestris]|uniref:Arylamine N-acetyltransferase n=2 Tax=Alicyclobacillus acidoterrestris TaxID=1450 RepID=T0D2Z3_ALIAG|nr:hypothetical protein N007_11275 [Alicyclobacillus acidoterrestris ATCC 49025]UNO49624.1 arylamine N-acetyltransferase [Alicyclobacillus acidoterrestris]